MYFWNLSTFADSEEYRTYFRSVFYWLWNYENRFSQRILEWDIIGWKKLSETPSWWKSLETTPHFQICQFSPSELIISDQGKILKIFHICKKFKWQKMTFRWIVTSRWPTSKWPRLFLWPLLWPLLFFDDNCFLKSSKHFPTCRLMKQKEQTKNEFVAKK